MYDVSCATIPVNICNLFMSIKKVHRYDTRSSTSNNLFTNYARTNIQKHALSSVGVKLWNEIPPNIRESPKRLFKNRIKEYLFKFLSSSGYDAEVTNIFKN
jgi:hypothetical protein